MYAKIKDSQIITFPYMLNDFLADNPFTHYDMVDIDIGALFPHTDTALVDGFELVSVTQPSIPVYDPLLEAVIQSDTPVLDNGNWILPWVITKLDSTAIDLMRDQAKAHTWELIKIERDKRRVSGVNLPVNDRSYWFHSDDASRIQQLGLILMGASIPSNLQWKTMSGEFVVMTQALAADIFRAIAISDQNIFRLAEQHRIMMESSPDPRIYDYTQGWPPTYEEANK